MAGHLASGCRRCRRIVDVLRGVAGAARVEGDYDPPDGAIRCVKAVSAIHRAERLPARLVYDSFREPLPAGVRTQDRVTRHALYEAGRFYLDLRVEHQPGTGLVNLVGQLADRDHQPASAAPIPVLLMARNQMVASAVCNRFGEFHLEFQPTRRLRLHVQLADAGTRFELPLNRLMAVSASRPDRKGRQEPGPRTGNRRRVR